MPKCPSCKQMRPKESFYTPGGYRCVKCTDCRDALREKRKAQSAERIESEAALRQRAEKEARTKSEASKPDKSPSPKKRTFNRTCAFCGKTFEQSDLRFRKYCSDECRLAVAKAQAKKDWAAKQRPVSEVKCAECGELFLPINANQKLCGKKCKAARNKRVKRGQLAPSQPFALQSDPYEGNPKWGAVSMNSTSFNPLG